MNDEQQKNDNKPPDPLVSSDGVAAELAALKAENAELKRATQIARAREGVTTRLTRLGAASPELLFASVENALQFEDDGTLANIEALISNLQKKYPEQFAERKVASTIDAGAGRASLPQLTKERLARMKPAEIAALDWNDVRQVLSS